MNTGTQNNTETLKNTFNELSQLAQVLDAWGKNAKEGMPKIAIIGVIFNALAEKIFTPESKRYSVLDHSAYHNLLKDGPEKNGYEVAIATLKKTLHAGDSNTRAALRFMSGEKARGFMPVVRNKEELSRLAEKHSLSCFRKLLK